MLSIAPEADRLATAIKEAAPVDTGKLRDSVKVRRRRNDLDLEVTAGGDATITEHEGWPPVEGGDIPRMQMQNVSITEASTRAAAIGNNGGLPLGDDEK